MPGTLKTVFNNGGVPIATSADEFYQRQRLANQAQASDDARLQAQLQDSAANRALQLQTMGDYASRAREAQTARQEGYAHETGLETMRGGNALALGKQSGENALAVANVGNVVPLRALDNEQARWVEARKDGAARRALDDQYATVEGNMLGRVFADQAASTATGAPAQPMTQDQLLEQWAAFKNPAGVAESKRRAEDRADALAAQRAAVATALLGGMDPAGRQLGGQLLQGTPAFAGIDPGVLAKAFAPQADLITKEAREADLGALAERFAAKDASTIGFDPTSPDVERIATERDKLAAYFERTQGVDKEQAIEAANRVIESKLAPQADRWGTGWIKTLRQRLGIIR